jgi:hypothetical protein
LALFAALAGLALVGFHAQHRERRKMKEKKKKSMLQLGNEMAEEHHPIAPMSPLTHDENLRANALSLACRYYVETIVKDGDLYREMVRDNRVLKPATYIKVVEVAFAFEAFISGELKATTDELLEPEKAELEEITEQERGTSGAEPTAEK